MSGSKLITKWQQIRQKGTEDVFRAFLLYYTYI